MGDGQRGVQRVRRVCVGVDGGQGCRQDELGWPGVGGAGEQVGKHLLPRALVSESFFVIFFNIKKNGERF